MSLVKEERETIMRFDETPDAAKISTFNQTLIRKLKAWAEAGEPVKLLRADSIEGVNYCSYEIPKSWIQIRQPRKLTEEGKAQRAAIAEKARQKRAEMRYNRKNLYQE